MRRRTLRLGGWVVLATMSGCFGLEEKDLGECGNGVLETGEDCDGYGVNGGTHCLPAGHPAECRLTCAPKDGKPQSCPVGWHCGHDSICRAPSGSFADPLDLGQPSGHWLAVADFDGNGLDDVASLHSAHLAVHYLAADGRLQDSFHTPVDVLGKPSLAALDDDGLADLTLPTTDGLTVLRGSTARTLTPTTYASFNAPLGWRTVCVPDRRRD